MSRQDSFNILLDLLKGTQSDQPNNDKPVFWLGAGCSVHDGVPLMDELVSALMSGSAINWGSPQFRFDKLFEGQTATYRQQKLSPLINRTLRPDSPYHHLARLVVEGYVDTILTFNIDTLFEQALNQAGLNALVDFDLISAPELNDPALRARLLGTGRRIKLVKLHGDVESGINFMISEEIVEYGKTLHDAFCAISDRPAVVCGYSFLHLNVLNAFSRERRPLFYVNRSFPNTPAVLSLMVARNGGVANFVDAPLGLFDQFMSELSKRLP